MKSTVKRFVIVATLVFGTLFTCLGGAAVVAQGDDIGPSAFQGPFVYQGETTVTYKFFSQDCNAHTYQSTLASREIDETKTVTITETQVLTYYLHTPIHYDPNKSYPIVSYMSGDGISVFCDSSIGGTQVNIANFIEGSDYYVLHDKYRQNEVYGQTHINAWGVSVDTSGNYLTSYYEYVGGRKNALKLPHYTGATGNCDDRFVEEWAKLVYEQGKEEYDCFFLFLQPTDRMAFENKSNNKVVCIQNQVQDKAICAKYDSSVIKAHTFTTGACITTTYVASELSIDPTEQLLCQLIDDLMLQYNIDASRQYVAGFSLGAMFSYDICAHYPNRFACCMTTGLPSIDFSPQNIQNWTKTNFWGFNGTSDFCDANCVYTKDFVKAVNLAKKPDSDIKAYYSICQGGHSGNYIAGKASVKEGQAVDLFIDTYNFMFNSVKPIECLQESSNYKNAFSKIKLDAKASSNLIDNKYDLAFITGCPMGNFSSHGFVITTGEAKEHIYDQTKSVVVKGQVKKDTISLGGTNIDVNATDYGSSHLYDYVLRNIPSSITSFKFKAFATSPSGTYYSDEKQVNVLINGTEIKLEVIGL